MAYKSLQFGPPRQKLPILFFSFQSLVCVSHGQKFRTTQRRTRGVTWQNGRQTLKGNVWQK